MSRLPFSIGVALLLLVPACGGGDPLPAGGREPSAAGSDPSPTPAPDPSPTPAPDPRRTIALVGLGSPPPGPPVSGEIEVEAIVRTDVPARVEFYIDGRFVNVEFLWPYMLDGSDYDTRRLPDGEHTLLARAFYSDGASIEASRPFLVDNDRQGQSARADAQRLEVLVEDGDRDLAFALEGGEATAHQWVVDGRDFGRGCRQAPDLVLAPDVRVEEGRLRGEVAWRGTADDCAQGQGIVAIDAPVRGE